MRLEAIEGRDPQVRLPRWLRDRTAAAAPDVESAARHPVWLLAKKELRLQHLTFVVSGIYLLEWSTLWRAAELMAPGTSMASRSPSLTRLSQRGRRPAERIARQRGGETLRHARVPGAASDGDVEAVGRQSGDDVRRRAAAGGLLAGTPRSLQPVGRPASASTGGSRARSILLTAGSLYVSSLCASGLRALLASAAVMVAVVIAVPAFLGSDIGLELYRTVRSMLSASQAEWLRSWAEPLAVALAHGFSRACAAVRPGEPSLQRPQRQPRVAARLPGLPRG